MLDVLYCTHHVGHRIAICSSTVLYRLGERLVLLFYMFFYHFSRVTPVKWFLDGYVETLRKTTSLIKSIEGLSFCDGQDSLCSLGEGS